MIGSSSSQSCPAPRAAARMPRRRGPGALATLRTPSCSGTPRSGPRAGPTCASGATPRPAGRWGPCARPRRRGRHGPPGRSRSAPCGVPAGPTACQSCAASRGRAARSCGRSGMLPASTASPCRPGRGPRGRATPRSSGCASPCRPRGCPRSRSAGCSSRPSWPRSTRRARRRSWAASSSGASRRRGGRKGSSSSLRPLAASPPWRWRRRSRPLPATRRPLR
mmetsp:Transcript_16371/g.49432  ORF Transcript_16371/g.49432 Transcript_16371/m.49432 type:complete len:222 (-) Transcript_16371:855-1520(-)